MDGSSLFYNKGVRKIKERQAIEILWKTHKYEVMWHDQKSYNRIREMLKANCTYDEVENEIQNALSMQPSKGSVVNAYSHVWGYFKKFCRVSEKKLFKKLKDQYLADQISETTLLQFIYCMTIYYNIQYLKESSLIQNFSMTDDTDNDSLH